MEPTQDRISGPEVVDRKTHADRVEGGENGAEVVIVHDDPVGYLQLDRGRFEATALDQIGDRISQAGIP